MKLSEIMILTRKEIPVGRKNHTLLAFLCILLTGALLYWGCLYLGILSDFDDMKYIFKNPYTDGLDWSNIRGAFTVPFVGNYAPLHILSYALEYYLWPDNPVGYHFSNVVLHLLNAILLYLFMKQLTENPSISFFTAMVFLLHPVQVESVAWLSERKNLLSTALFWGAMLFYLRVFPPSGKDGEQVASRKTAVWYILSLLFFVMALLTKSSVVVLPLLLVLYHLYYARQLSFRKAGLAVAPFFLLSLVFSLITLVTQSGSILGLFEDSVSSHIYMMLFVLGKYIRLLLLPVNLSFQYDVPLLSQGFKPSMAGAFLFLGLFIAAGAMILWKHRKSFFWVWWMLICLLPVSQVVPIVTYMNDRHLYLPIIGFAALAGTGLEKIYRGAGTRALRFTGVLLPLLAYGLLTFHRIPVWNSAQSLWEDAERKAPGNHLPHVKAGVYYFQEGDYERALREFQMSIRLRPKYYNYEWLGNVYGRQKAWEQAIRYYRASLEEYPENAKVLRNLGIALNNVGRTEEALETLKSATTFQPTYVQPYLDLGALYEMKHADEQAKETYQRLIQANPECVAGYLALADYYGQRHERERAGNYLETAREIAEKGSPLDKIEVEIKARSLETSAVEPGS